MAVLGRLKVAPNQRLDLPDLVAFDAYSAGDWKGFLEAMVGSKPYLIKGFEVFQPNTLIGNPAGSVDIVLGSSSLWWSTGEEGSFFVSLPGAANKSVTLITDATNYIEMTLTLDSRAQDARALWDPGANGGAGGEFTQVVDTENFLDVEVTRNNTGFSDDKIPIAKIVVNSSNNVVSITDCRPLLFRLGTGGNTPDPLNSYIWKDDPAGYSRQDTPTTMSSPSDPNVFRGADKNILSFKEWMDAVMSRLKEIDGGSKWFQATGGTGDGGGSLSLTHLFQDSQAGHSVLPDRKVTFTWSKANDGKFRSENAVGYNAPARWGTTFGQLRWQLGGAFVSASNRAYSDFTFEISVADGQNLYLALQRDAAINGDPIVHFENQSGVTGFCSAFGAGSFTGIACGDYIRKESGNVYQYYRVAELRVSAGTPFANGTVEGTVADATVQYLLLETHDGPIVTTDEPFRYFRKSYTQADLIASDVGTLDTSRYWLGRRFGSMFFLRDYGDMQPGEETEVIDDHATYSQGGGNGLIVEHAYDAVYDSSLGYKLKGGATTTLITLRRRLEDNTVGTPSNVDNSGAMLTYTIAAPIGTIADNSGLWVRLGTTSGGLGSGDVTDVTTDNVWQVLDPASTPLRTYDNANVYLVARKFTIGGIPCLIFTDGSTLAGDGMWTNQHQAIQGDFYLKPFTQWSIPFISTTGGKFAQNNAEFFWNNGAGPDSAGQMGIRNFRIGKASTYDVIDQAVARDLYVLPTLGSFTIKFGDASSTVYIPGDLVVDGTTTSINTSILQVDDKLITVGVGNILNGAFGSGIEAADNTLQATQLATTSGQVFVDITYASAHGYALGDVIGVDSNTAVGGITAGQLSSSYTVVTTGAAVGDAQVINSTKIRVWSLGTATSTATLALSPPTTSVRTYTSPWSIRVSSSAGTYTSGITSWAFRVKGVATAPTITPFSGYGIVPTAHSSNMQAGRIPFVNDDNGGPSGADTTLNFTANLSWDNSTNTLTIGGTTSFAGNLLPATDNTYDIGSTTLRWKTLHVGPGSVVVHNDATNTNKISVDFSGSIGRLVSDAATPVRVTVGSLTGLNIDTAGRTGLSGTTVAAALVNIDNGGTVLTSGGTQNVLRLSSTLNAATSRILDINPQLTTATGADLYGIVYSNMTLSGGATVANQAAILINDISGATNNFGIVSSISAGSGKWNVYSNGTATNYFAGGVGIGNGTQASINSQRLLIGVNTDTTAAGGISFGTDVTLYRTAAGALTTGANFLTSTDNVGVLGSTSIRWNTIHLGPAGVVAHNDATNTLKVTLGFTSTTATLTSDAATPLAIGVGTASAIQIDTANRIGLMSAPNSATAIYFNQTAVSTTGSGQFGLVVQPRLSGTASSIFLDVEATQVTAAVTDLASIRITNPAMLSGATATNNYAIAINDQTNGVNNFGIYSSIAAGTNRWFLYGVGTATSYLAGGLGIGNSTQASINAQRLLLGVNTDTTPAGGMNFGTDVNLYRSAADTLKTDDNFIVGSNLTVSGSQILNGSLRLNYGTTRTANYSVATTDCVVPFDTTAAVANVTATLPASVAGNKGQMVIIKDVGGATNLLNKAVIIAPTGTDTIDGANSSITMTISRFSLTFVSNGAGGWTIH